MKQVAEKIYRENVKKIHQSIWKIYIDKIQVNPYAHKTTAGDFLVQICHDDGTINIITECKQTQIDKRFDTFRVTQVSKLKEWNDRVYDNKSYLFIVWWGGRKKKSRFYLIEIDDWIDFTTHHPRRSIKLDEFNDWFSSDDVTHLINR